MLRRVKLFSKIKLVKDLIGFGSKLLMFGRKSLSDKIKDGEAFGLSSIGLSF